MSYRCLSRACGTSAFYGIMKTYVFLSSLSHTEFKKCQAGKFQIEVYLQLGTKDLNPSVKSSGGPAYPVQKVMFWSILSIFLCPSSIELDLLQVSVPPYRRYIRYSAVIILICQRRFLVKNRTLKKHFQFSE